MYQCRNRLDGCSHRANSKDIRKHEQECKFSPIKCPLHELLECGWKGLSKVIISHMKIEHTNLLLFEPLVIRITYFDEETSDEQRVTKVHGELFRLRLGYNNEKKKFYSTVQIVGAIEDGKKFLYEVQVTDLQTKCMQLTSRKFCGGINEKKNELSHCTVWPLDMILPFMSDDDHVEVRYKIIRV